MISRKRTQGTQSEEFGEIAELSGKVSTEPSPNCTQVSVLRSLRSFAAKLISVFRLNHLK